METMPKYTCKKEVWALKIAAAEVNQDGSVTIAPENKEYAVFTTMTDFGSRFKGDEADPGYYVCYEDGYVSWSPSKAFEDGYDLKPTADAYEGDVLR
jgi:hypothetical protein